MPRPGDLTIDDATQPLRAPWPTYGQMVRVERARVTYVRKRLRIAIANLRAWRFRPVLDSTIRRLPCLYAPLASHPALFAPLLGRFLRVRDWTASELVETFSHDLEFTGARIHAALPDFFARDLRDSLWTDPEHGYEIQIALNLRYPHEGLWRVELYDPAQTLLFSLSFSVLPGATMFVGSVQGGRSTCGQDLPGAIRFATKRFEGLRPPFLLLEVVRTLARAWELRGLVGVSTRNQLKGNSGSRYADQVRFSYDTFWLECGGRPSAEGDWRVSLDPRRSDPAAIPSRKRAMYRRRDALIARLSESVASRLGPERTAEPPLFDVAALLTTAESPLVA